MKTPVLPLLILALLATASTDSRAANAGYLTQKAPAEPKTVQTPPETPALEPALVPEDQGKEPALAPAVAQKTEAAPSPDIVSKLDEAIDAVAQTISSTRPAVNPSEYTVGIDDVLEIRVLKPEEILTLATVTPDGSINFPYIGNVNIKGRTIVQVQEEIQNRLANGYMRYPIVSVSLKESRSRKFFVYGEVLKPGPYPIEENMSVLRAISMSGGFTRFGSSSRVKVLRPKKTGPGYETIKVNIKAVMEGNSDEDVLLMQGDIMTVSEGVF